MTTFDEWIKTVADACDLLGNEDVADESPRYELAKQSYLAGLRAAVGMACNLCAENKPPYEHNSPIFGMILLHDGNWGGSRCPSEKIHREIASIEGEQ